jgi:hypothetical protein
LSRVTRPTGSGGSSTGRTSARPCTSAE